MGLFSFVALRAPCKEAWVSLLDDETRLDM